MTLAALIQESKEQREAWRYTDLSPYADLKPVPVQMLARVVDLPEALTRQRLVFVDGRYRQDLSCVEGLPEGFIAFCDDNKTRCVLSLSGQMCLAIDPVELLFVSTPQEQANEAALSMEITLGANSRLTLIERHVSLGLGAKRVRNVTMRIDLVEQAKLIHGKIVAESMGSMHFAKTKVSVAQGAFYDHFGVIADGLLSRCATEIVLTGSLAETRLLTLMLLRGCAHGAIDSLVRHEAIDTGSRQICKAVLDDKAQGVFQGKTRVEKDAQKTDGYQLCRALLLSNSAEMDAKPELEIYADDVKCSHGATLGDLDEESLFYLRSRGISEKEARRLLIEAFVADLVEQLPEGALRNAVRKEVAGWLR
jgi:Fe-S cluster assembly protein SufD